MFKVDDRVKLREDQCMYYMTGDICTVRYVDEEHDCYGINSDSDPEASYLYVGCNDLIHVTNVPSTKPAVRTFATGATRDTDENKLDYEGFLSPLVLKAFAEYMHEKRKMPDGSMRDSDNWQKGIPLDAYMKSMFRHFMSVWTHHRGHEGLFDNDADHIEELLALLFNVQGMLHEKLKVRQYGRA